MNARRILLWLPVAALLAGCRGERAAPDLLTLTVSAAASLREAMTDVAAVYQAEHPEVRIRNNFAASGVLQRQIERGAGADLFVSAGERQMDALAAQGLIDGDTRRVFARNELVLVVPRSAPGAVRSFADLAGVGRVAIGDPAFVPAGEYARQTLRSLGLWNAVKGRAVLGQNVRQVLTYVERGETDAGLVYRTDAATARVRVVAAAPPASHRPIVYPAAVVAGSEHPAEARRYLEFLAGPAARRVLRGRGFAAPG